ARRSGSPPPSRKAPGWPATARAARRTSLAGISPAGDPARHGSWAGPRTSERRRSMARIDAPGTGLRPPSSLDGVGQWRLVFTLATYVPAADGYHIGRAICQGFSDRVK